MKKWLVGLVVLVAVLGAVGSSGAAVKSVQMTKRLNHGAAGGQTDSSTFTLKVCSTTAVGDTLIPVDLSDLEPAYVPPGAAATTAFYPIKIGSCFPVNGKADSIYYKYRVSVDGTNWSTFTAITGGPAGSTSDLCLVAPVSQDADAGATNSFLIKWVQFVILSDAGGAIPNATVWLNYFTK